MPGRVGAQPPRLERAGVDVCFAGDRMRRRPTYWCLQAAGQAARKLWPSELPLRGLSLSRPARLPPRPGPALGDPALSAGSSRNSHLPTSGERDWRGVRQLAVGADQPQCSRSRHQPCRARAWSNGVPWRDTRRTAGPRRLDQFGRHRRIAVLRRPRDWCCPLRWRPAGWDAGPLRTAISGNGLPAVAPGGRRLRPHTAHGRNRTRRTRRRPGPG